MQRPQRYTPMNVHCHYDYDKNTNNTLSNCKGEREEGNMLSTSNIVPFLATTNVSSISPSPPPVVVIAEDLKLNPSSAIHHVEQQPCTNDTVTTLRNAFPSSALQSTSAIVTRSAPPPRVPRQELLSPVVPIEPSKLSDPNSRKGHERFMIRNNNHNDTSFKYSQPVTTDALPVTHVSKSSSRSLSGERTDSSSSVPPFAVPLDYNPQQHQLPSHRSHQQQHGLGHE
eukprot:PhF_6_TR30127/c0_g1_i2/m.44053